MPGLGYEILRERTKAIIGTPDTTAKIERLKGMAYSPKKGEKAKIKKLRQLIKDIESAADTQNTGDIDPDLYWYIMIEAGLITIDDNFQVLGGDGVLREDLKAIVGEDGALVFNLIRYIEQIPLPNIHTEKLFWDAYFAVVARGKESNIILTRSQDTQTQAIAIRIRDTLVQGAFEDIDYAPKGDQTILLKNLMLDTLVFFFGDKHRTCYMDTVLNRVARFESLEDIKYFAETILKVSGEENLGFKNLLDNLSEEEQTDLVEFGKVMRSVIVESHRENSQLHTLDPTNLESDAEVNRYLQLKYNGTITLDDFKEIIESENSKDLTAQCIAQLIKLVKPKAQAHQYQSQHAHASLSDYATFSSLGFYLRSGPEDRWTKGLKSSSLDQRDMISLLTIKAELLELWETIDSPANKDDDKKLIVMRKFTSCNSPLSSKEEEAEFTKVELLGIKLGCKYEDSQRLYCTFMDLPGTSAACRARIDELGKEKGSPDKQGGSGIGKKSGGGSKTEDKFSYTSLILSTVVTIAIPASLRIIKTKLDALPAFLRTSKVLDSILKMPTVGVVFNVMVMLCALRGLTSKHGAPLPSLRESNLPVFIAYAVIDKAFGKSPRRGE